MQQTNQNGTYYPFGQEPDNPDRNPGSWENALYPINKQKDSDIHRLEEIIINLTKRVEKLESHYM